MTSDPNITNLLGMAKTAEAGGNNAEALSYYNRILEIEPRLPDAWMGKGRSAGWQSTLANFRVNEAIVAFGHAIGCSSDAERSSTIQQAVAEANHLIATLYGLARRHLEEFATLSGTWPSYVGQIGQLTNAQQEVYEWDSNNIESLKNIEHFCKDNIEGYKSWDSYNGSALHSITPEYEAVLRDQMDRANERLKALDESYAAPQVEKKSSDACFVATATMGDIDHPDVRLLRVFRDKILSRSSTGIKFIRGYYRHGPRIAKIIERHMLLKRISYRFIIVPAVLIAQRALQQIKPS